MSKFIAILVSIILVLLVAISARSIISYKIAMKTVESNRLFRDSQLQKALNPMGGQAQEAEKNLSVTVNRSFKFKDNILLELTLQNISNVETSFAFNRKLKDINMMECDELTSPSYADFPLTDVERKGFLSQKYTSTFAPGEGLRGYYCYRCR